jgi:hypothetical protein
MASEVLSDKAVIDRLGGIAAVASALKYSTDYAVKKWYQRGIPWKHRAKVKQLAAQKRKRLPADFVVERRAA